jgi:hypothetical protein
LFLLFFISCDGDRNKTVDDDVTDEPENTYDLKAKPVKLSVGYDHICGIFGSNNHFKCIKTGDTMIEVDATLLKESKDSWISISTSSNGFFRPSSCGIKESDSKLYC